MPQRKESKPSSMRIPYPSAKPPWEVPESQLLRGPRLAEYILANMREFTVNGCDARVSWFGDGYGICLREKTTQFFCEKHKEFQQLLESFPIIKPS
jgi:hypothetical protein